MAEIDPMYNLVNTILDDKEIVILLGAGASVEGTQNNKNCPNFDEFIDNILKNWGFDPTEKEKRIENFSTIIKKWETEKKLSARLSQYFDGEPGAAHYYLAALSIALHGESNALLYLTTNYDNMMQKAFTNLERNPVRTFSTAVIALRSYMTNSKFLDIAENMEVHLKGGWPVVLKLFGDLNSQSPIFKPDDMIFELPVKNKLLEWMKKPMILIGNNFLEKIIEELLIESRGASPIFLVIPSDKKIPSSIRNLERVYHIKKSFSEFILDLLKILKKRNPKISEKVDKILSQLPMPLSSIKKSVTAEQKSCVEPDDSSIVNQITPVIKVLFLSANPKTTLRLRLDEEIREIENGLFRSKMRFQFKIHSAWVVGIRDLRRILLTYQPDIVHFIGHGRSEGLVLEDELGMAVNISSEVLSGLFELFSDHVKCVIFSACYSARQADAISKHINVIGMRKEIEDRTSIEFAVGFYDALGAGRSVEEAFKFGCIAILSNLPEHLFPILKLKKKNQSDFIPAEQQDQVLDSLITVAKQFFEKVNAKVIQNVNSSTLRIESINGHLQLYVPIQVLLVDGEPTERSVMELVRQAKRIGKGHTNYAGILIYREQPNALCRMKMVEVRLKENFILIPLPLISVKKALLERETCFGLLTKYAERYLPGADFFDDRNAIGDTFSFFGRLEQLQRLGEELQQNQSIGLFGLRKSGKTSILLQLNFVLRTNPVVYVDFQIYGGKTIYGAQFFNNVIQQLSTLLKIAEIVEEDFPVNYEFKLFPTNMPAKELTTEFSKQIIELAQILQRVGYKLPIICLLDEVERIIPFSDDPKDKVEEFNACFGALRALSQQYRNLSLLVADVHPDFNWINQWQQPDVPTNPVFNFFKDRFIDPFLEEDTITMLKDIGALMMRSFDEQTLSAIHAKSGGHPFIARQLASMLCNNIPIEVAQYITWEKSQNYLEDALHHSGILIDYIEQNIWADFSKRHSDAEMLVLQKLTSNTSGFSRSELLSHLHKQCSKNKILKALLWLDSIGLVERKLEGKKELYKIRIPLLAQWLEMEYGRTEE